MSAPAISVVMPVYNREPLLPRSVESILGQSFGDFEFIIVDDGSTDGSVEVLQRYARQDSRIRLLGLPVNCGQSMARAVGHNAAGGRYIAVMDSDDFAVPHRFERQYAFMESNPEITLAGAQAVKVMPERRINMEMVQDDAQIKALLIHVDSAFVHPTVIMRREFLHRHHLNYASERRGDDDYEFYNRLVAAGARFANMSDPLLEYYRHDGNISANSPDHERRKQPLREYLLALYYPDLTCREVKALARILTKPVQVSVNQAVEGLLAGQKALRFRESVYGESKALLSGVLIRSLKGVEKAIARSVER